MDPVMNVKLSRKQTAESVHTQHIFGKGKG